MVSVVGIRFKKAGKVYYFSPGDNLVKEGDNVIVETARGMEFGTCIISSREVDEDSIKMCIRDRIYTKLDFISNML